MTETTIRAELAASIRRVAAEYRRLPPDRQPSVHWDDVDVVLEEALRADDRDQAFSAIRRWRDFHLAKFRRAAS